MPEEFAAFRLAYMDNYLNTKDDGRAGKEVLARLIQALESAMVAGVDVVQTDNPEIGKLVGTLHAALVEEVKQK